MSDIEIERKFLLLPCIPDALLQSWDIPYKKEHLEQFYVPTESSPYTRYRKKNNSYYKTVKSGEGMVRQEHEHRVSRQEYLDHRNQPQGRIITKERYTFEYENNTFELDTFHGGLEGLCYLEIEFDDEQKALAFDLPPLLNTLLVTEVTFDNAFNNASLANSQMLPAPQLKTEYVDKKKQLHKLSAFLPVSQTLAAIVYELAKTLQKHRRDLLKDPSDVEELHQFRVGLRKLRALLKEFKEFIDPEWYENHYKKLSTLMKRTNKKRDNDVAMIDIGALRKELDTKDKTLKALKHTLHKKNRHLEESLVTFLRSDALKNELKHLSKLSQETEVFLPAAGQPLILVAISLINTRIETILEDAKHICEDTGCDIYHDLRIEFKKLRYMVELLEPLAQAEKFETVAGKLKTIQTILGDINDFHVQEAQLEKFKKGMKKEKKSLQHLQDKMKTKEEKNKEAFEDAMIEFKEEQLLYQTLLFVR